MSNTRPFSVRRRAFTLLEMIVNLALVTLIVAGISSAMVLVSRGLPETGGAQASFDVARVLNDFAEELRTATYITNRSHRSITLTTPDRNNDGLPEVVTYDWSGTSGAALTRTQNSADPVTLIHGTAQFNLAFEDTVRTTTISGPPTESSETELMSYTDTSANLADAEVSDVESWAQYFKPTLPQDTSSWSVGRVEFMAKSAVHKQPTTVELRVPENDLTPSATVIDSATLDSGELGKNHAWITKTFSAATALSPSDGLCLTFQADSGRPAHVQYIERGVTLNNAALVHGQPDWGTAQSTQALLFKIHGTTTAPGPQLAWTSLSTTGIRVRIAASEALHVIETHVRMLNAPCVADALWAADFTADPTLLDINADGVADWIAAGAGFVEGQLTTGRWQIDRALDSNPENDFDTLTVIEAQVRDTVSSDDGAGIAVNFDRNGTTCAPLSVIIRLESDNTQTLRLRNDIDGGETVTLAQVGQLSSAFHAVRLILDDRSDTVNLTVDGEDRGTFNYTRFSTIDSRRTVRVYDAGSGGEIGEVTIHQGGYLGLDSNTHPVAAAGISPTSGDAPLELDFDGRGSSDSDAEALLYAWDFGDGTATDASNGKTSLTAAGVYTATLTVTDDKGGVSMDQVHITVEASE